MRKNKIHFTKINGYSRKIHVAKCGIRTNVQNTTFDVNDITCKTCEKLMASEEVEDFKLVFDGLEDNIRPFCLLSEYERNILTQFRYQGGYTVEFMTNQGAWRTLYGSESIGHKANGIYRLCKYDYLPLLFEDFSNVNKSLSFIEGQQYREILGESFTGGILIGRIDGYSALSPREIFDQGRFANGMRIGYKVPQKLYEKAEEAWGHTDETKVADFIYQNGLTIEN